MSDQDHRENKQEGVAQSDSTQDSSTQAETENAAAGQADRDATDEAAGEPEEQNGEPAPGAGEQAGPVSVPADEVGPEDEQEQPEKVEQIDPLEQAQAEARKLREQLLRVAADFDNYRKRARREHEEAARKAKIDLLRELLPVFDNMERAVAHAEQATDAKAVAKGVEMVIRQFLDTLEKVGVSRVKSVGEVFDPNVHEAIQQMETDEQAPGSVVAEMLPGYILGERLLRASMVVVAKAPPEPEPESEPESEPDTEPEPKAEPEAGKEQEAASSEVVEAQAEVVALDENGEAEATSERKDEPS